MSAWPGHGPWCVCESTPHQRQKPARSCLAKSRPCYELTKGIFASAVQQSRLPCSMHPCVLVRELLSSTAYCSSSPLADDQEAWSVPA